MVSRRYICGVCVCVCACVCVHVHLHVCVCFCCIDMGEYQCLAILFLFNVYSENVHPSFLHQTIELCACHSVVHLKRKEKKVVVM